MAHPRVIRNYGKRHFEEIKSLGKEAIFTIRQGKQDEDYPGAYRTNIKRWRKDKKSTLKPVRTFSKPYLQYALTMITNLTFSLYFNWTMVFSAPLSTLATVIVYPTFMVALLILELVLKVFLEYLGGRQLILYWSQRYGSGLSIINWGDPSFLLSSETVDRVRKTAPILGMDVAKDDRNGHIFDISIAQTMTVLAALVYERSDQLVEQAYRTLMASPDDMDADDGIETRTERLVKKLLWKSEQRIREIAKPMGLHFEGISELKSLGGPFCGVFWSKTHPFLVVCFKGTTPTNYEEFLVDCSIQRVDARPYVFGAAHQGFYDSVFPTTDFGDNDKRDPYQAILEALREKAKLYHPGRKVQVWIAGHSLGASMSCLLFSRWLKCPEDLQEDLCLRDCYVIGTPAVGDDDFASMFASHSNSPSHRRPTLWRVINKYDVICRLPVGYDNRIFGRFVSKWDFFNYAHVGREALIPFKDDKPLRLKPSSYQSPGQMRVIASNGKIDGKPPSDATKLKAHADDDHVTDKISHVFPSPQSSRQSSSSSTRNNDDTDDTDADDDDGDGDDVDDNNHDNNIDHIDVKEALNRTVNPYLISSPLDATSLPKWMQYIHGRRKQLYRWMPASMKFFVLEQQQKQSEKHNTVSEATSKSLINPIVLLEHLYPVFIMDHIPHSYYKGLEEARKFCAQ